MSFSSLIKRIEEEYPEEKFKHYNSYVKSKTKEIFVFHHDDGGDRRYLGILESLKSKSWAPRLLKVIHHDEITAVITSRITGNTLYDMALRGLLSKDIIDKVLSIMTELHELGVVHNNIQPNSFIINSKGEVFLTMLNCARSTDFLDSRFKEDNVDLGKTLHSCIFNTQCSLNTAVYI